MTFLRPTFRACIAHVLRLRTRHQVRWVYARWVVALVQHIQAVGYWADIHGIGRSVSSPRLPIPANAAIAMVALCPNPLDAAGGPLDARALKPLLYRSVISELSTCAHLRRYRFRGLRLRARLAVDLERDSSVACNSGRAGSNRSSIVANTVLIEIGQHVLDVLLCAARKDRHGNCQNHKDAEGSAICAFVEIFHVPFTSQIAAA